MSGSRRRLPQHRAQQQQKRVEQHSEEEKKCSHSVLVDVSRDTLDNVRCQPVVNNPKQMNSKKLILAATGGTKVVGGGSVVRCCPCGCRSVHGWIQLILLTTMFVLVLDTILTANRNRHHGINHKSSQLQSPWDPSWQSLWSTSEARTGATDRNGPSIHQSADRSQVVTRNMEMQEMILKQQQHMLRKDHPSTALVFDTIFANRRKKRQPQLTDEGEGNSNDQKLNMARRYVQNREPQQVISQGDSPRNDYLMDRFSKGSDRPILLSEETQCAVARQAEPWQIDFPNDPTQRPSIALQSNHPNCPDALQAFSSIPPIMVEESSSSSSSSSSSHASAKITLALFYYQCHNES
ncbi:hypothetical protein ACA910_022038 [Epithemia clementina (nom. ined.)]